MKKKIELERQEILVIGNQQETISFAAKQFIEIAKKAIEEKKCFYVALSGGTTPKLIFEYIKDPSLNCQIAWEKVFLFWSDERAVPPSSSESNYKMAMDALFSSLPIPEKNIFRMKAESSIAEEAMEYEKTIQKLVKNNSFDLIMLGMGDDGHTASLFPETKALETEGRLVIENFVPKLNRWRMTFTYDCINRAKNILIYVMGNSKSKMVNKALKNNEDSDIPIRKVGTNHHKATWILDEEAASELLTDANYQF